MRAARAARRTAPGRSASRVGRPAGSRGSTRAWSSIATFAPSTARAEAPGVGCREPGVRPATVGGREDLVEEAGHVPARVQLDLEPRSDLRHDRPRPVRRAGRPAPPRGAPEIATRRSGSGAKSRVNSGNSASPSADAPVERRSQMRSDLGAVEAEPDVMQLELALEARLGGQPGAGRAPRPPPGARGRVRCRRGPAPATDPPGGRPRRGCRGRSPRSARIRRPGGSALRPGRRNRSSSGPGVARGGGAAELDARRRLRLVTGSQRRRAGRTSRRRSRARAADRRARRAPARCSASASRMARIVVSTSRALDAVVRHGPDLAVRA